MHHELAARRAAVGGDDRGLDAELVRRCRLAFADVLDLGRMEGIELPALPLLLRSAHVNGRAEAFAVFDLGAAPGKPLWPGSSTSAGVSDQGERCGMGHQET